MGVERVMDVKYVLLECSKRALPRSNSQHELGVGGWGGVRNLGQTALARVSSTLRSWLRRRGTRFYPSELTCTEGTVS